MSLRCYLTSLGDPPILFRYLPSKNSLIRYFVIILGAGHADDLGYLFKNHRTPQIKPGSQEDISIDRMIKLWTNFAKYGNPTPEEDELLQNIKWPSTSDESLTYLEIGNSLSIGSNPDQTRIQFWDEIYKLYSKTT